MSLSKTRVYVFLIFLSAFIIIILYSFVYIIFSQRNQATYAFADSDPKKTRGSILDRNSEVLAIQEPSYNLSAWKPEMENTEETTAVIASILGEDVNSLREKLASQRNYVLLARSISNHAAERIQSLKEAGGLSGVHLEENLQRKYPFREFSEPFVGYVNIDNKGLDGIEYIYNDALAQGQQVRLTLDIRLQQLLQTYLDTELAEHKARYLNAVLLKSDTGEVLSAISIPSFDPNKFYTYPDEQRRNRLIRNVYEPGSVFKVFSITSLLELGTISTYSRFDASRPFLPLDASFQINDINVYGNISTQQIIQFSSNVGAAHAASTSDDARFHALLRQFGFGSSTGININGESTGIFTEPETWSNRSKVTIAIGQEVAVTAMQIAKAATAIANQGILVTPFIVDSILSPQDAASPPVNPSPNARQIISPNNAQLMLEFMNTATKPEGTARRIALDSVEIAAKTGTAEIYDPVKREYSDSRFIASILCIFPFEEPEYILYLAVHEPRAGQFYGGQVAAPIARELISIILGYADLHYNTEQTIVQDFPDPLPIPTFTNVMPLLIGQPKRNIVYLKTVTAHPIQFKGNGWVVSQFPEAGTPLEKNQSIFVELGY